MMIVADAQMCGLVVEVAANAVVAVADGWDVVGLPRVFVLEKLLPRPNGKH